MDTDIAAHILEIASGLFADLVPAEVGATSDPFFRAGVELANAVPSTEPRVVPRMHLFPPTLARLYAKYDPRVEFHDRARGWIVLSATEVLRRYDALAGVGQTRVVDIAVQYAGMGHVRTCTYDPTTRLTATLWDGGANGWEREANYNEKLVRGDDPTSIPFDTWWKDRPAFLG